MSTMRTPMLKPPACKSYGPNGLVPRVPGSASYQALGGGWTVMIDCKPGIRWYTTVRSSRVVPGHAPIPGTRQTSVRWWNLVGTVVSDEGSSGQIKPGQKDPTQAVG
ncbi:hypothetical protein TIFTF001_053039 [Ficus carica]|uniref:Uncharacterized protein n=1 Tax=Ficus carica TaxID=3494 RepID=A0AA88EFA2_FICCA|nr:hypothetical protein TIFTF001_053039 [Ficus carica]